MQNYVVNWLLTVRKQIKSHLQLFTLYGTATDNIILPQLATRQYQMHENRT